MLPRSIFLFFSSIKCNKTTSRMRLGEMMSFIASREARVLLEVLKEVMEATNVET